MDVVFYIAVGGTLYSCYLHRFIERVSSSGLGGVRGGGRYTGRIRKHFICSISFSLSSFHCVVGLIAGCFDNIIRVPSVCQITHIPC